MRGVKRLCGLMGAVAAGLVLAPSPASAAIPATLHDPANCTELNPAPGYVAHKCDDGVPPSGGTTPNAGGTDAITVPAKYGNEDYIGLPEKAGDAAGVPGADGSGEIALDVDVTLPNLPPGRNGYPLLFFMHGCCGGDKTNWEEEEIDASGQRWHYSNAWFAARGYVVVNFTARGFVNGSNRGSTGETQLDHRSYEINDYQHLACQILGAAGEFSDVSGESVAINPNRVVTTGGSYGAGFTWMSITDPHWTCTADTGAGGEEMRLVAAAPKYGWTDLTYSLVPTGRHFQTPDRLPAADACDTGPVTSTGAACEGPAVNGVPKLTIVSGLYASGKTGIGPNAPHTTFSTEVDSVFVCLQGVYPAPPACESTINDSFQNFVNGRSAYFQQRFFDKIKSDPSYRVPIYSSGTTTDPLFPGSEHRRMLNRLRKLVPGYPIQAYYGDYQHFVQNKAREWGDLCGADNHVCSNDDYPPGQYDAKPAGLTRRGATMRANDFIDHYAKPRLNANEPLPEFDVTASLQICPAIAGGAPELPGKQFTAPTFERLTRGFLDLDFDGPRTTTSDVPGNPHAVNSDPVGNSVNNGGACAIESGAAGAGVAVFESEPLEKNRTLIGAPRITAEFEPLAATAVQLDARIYDVLPGGNALLVDRGPRILTPAELDAGYVEFETHGNGWRFGPGHKIRLELTQDDEPFVKQSATPSSLTLSSVEMVLPVREQLRGRCGNRRTGDRFDNRFLIGGVAGDRIRGRAGDDRALGKEGADCVNGGAGSDRVIGGPGKDRVTGGPGKDVIKGGKGDDRLAARDGTRDKVKCGKGKDFAKVDRIDKLQGCEKVRRA